MAKKGKKYTANVALVEKAKLYDSAEALDLVCKTATAKFDETVEVHIRLGVDSRPADQSSFLLKVPMKKLQRQQALTMSAVLSSQKRFRRKTGLTTM